MRAFSTTDSTYKVSVESKTLATHQKEYNPYSTKMTMLDQQTAARKRQLCSWHDPIQTASAWLAHGILPRTSDGLARSCMWYFGWAPPSLIDNTKRTSTVFPRGVSESVLQASISFRSLIFFSIAKNYVTTCTLQMGKHHPPGHALLATNLRATT